MQLAQEAYELAASPPAIDYSRNIDSTYRDDLTRRTRSHLLRFALDVKIITETLMNSLPKARAHVLKEWIIDGTNYSDWQLSHKKRKLLKIDRLELKQRLRTGLR
jgi:hypothetical protein